MDDRVREESVVRSEGPHGGSELVVDRSPDGRIRVPPSRSSPFTYVSVKVNPSLRREARRHRLEGHVYVDRSQ
jgi:hypothetical protein